MIFLTASLSAPFAAQARELPEELHGHWGEEHHCAAQQAVGLDNPVARGEDAPYRLQSQWISRWHFYCLVLRLDDLGERDGASTWRARVLCGEDAIERPYQVDIVRRDDTIALTWYSADSNDGLFRPWSTGPFPFCRFPGS
ncbi:MAG: hypothetical protein KI785_14430 [Devosiaceae bacterium]|nr:hypothetical protein [Devosiaceae bacterium MH13]